MNSRERVLAALALKQPDRVPFFDNVDLSFQKMVMGRETFDKLEFVETMQFDAMDYTEFTPPSYVRTQSVAGSTRKIQVEGLIKQRGDLEQVRLPELNDSFLITPAVSSTAMERPTRRSSSAAAPAAPACCKAWAWMGFRTPYMMIPN